MGSTGLVFDQAVDLLKYKLVRSIDTGDAVMNNTLAVVAGGAVTLGSGWIKTACGAAAASVSAYFFPGGDAAKLGDAKDTGLVGDADRVRFRTGPTAVTAEMAVHALPVTDARQLRQLLDWVEVTYPTSCPRIESKRVPGERASWSHVTRRPLPSSSSSASALPSSPKTEREEEEAAENVSNRSVWRRCIRKRRRTQSSAPSFAAPLKTATTTAVATTPTEIPYVTPRRRTVRDLDTICARYAMFPVWRHAGHAVFLSGARRTEKEREDDDGGGDDDDESGSGGGNGDGDGGSRSWNLVVRSASTDAALHFAMLFRDPTAEQLAAERALVVEAERVKAAAVAAAIAASAATAAAAAGKSRGRGGRRPAATTTPTPTIASDTDTGNTLSSSPPPPPADARMPTRLQAYVLPEARDPDADPPTQRYAMDMMKLYALRTWPRAKDCQKLNARWSLDAMVFRDKAQLEALVADYERCLRAADPYGCRKIGIIVAGEYGTGKSSLLPALAQRLGMNVVRWDLSASADRDEVRAAFQFAVEQRGIISLDEIDKLLDRLAHPQLAALAAERARELADAKELMLALEKVDETKYAQARDAYVRLVAARNKEPVDLAFLQSLLDGVDDSSGRVIVASTNHPERIPPALLRPGRFDVQSRMRHFTGAQTRQLMRLMFLWRTAAKTVGDDEGGDDDANDDDDGGEAEKDFNLDAGDAAPAAANAREEKRGNEESKTPRSDRASLSSLLSLSSPPPPKLEVGDSKNGSSSSSSKNDDTGRGGVGADDDGSKSERRESKEEKRLPRRTKALVPRGERAVALAAELRQWCGYSERDANAAAWLEEVPLPDGIWSPAQVVSARQKHRTLRATAVYLSTQRPESFSERVVPPHVSSSPSSSLSSAPAPGTLSAVPVTAVSLPPTEAVDSRPTMSPPELSPTPPMETLTPSTEKLGKSTAGGGAKRRRVNDDEEEEKEE